MHAQLKRARLVAAAVLVIGLFAVAVLVSSAGGTPQTGVTTEVLSRGTIADSFRVRVGGIKIKVKGPVDVAVARLSFQPGGTSGWHSHPAATLAAVTKGTVTRLMAEGCTRESFSAGQGFAETGPNEVHMVRNEGSVPAETIVSFVVPVGAPLRIDQPAPADCNP
jgi:quercetin dioxygenase-like cupin family protein